MLQRPFYSFLLFLFFSPVFSAAQSPCTELFFSEYIEGSGSNKAVEIFNPSNNPVVLDSYSVRLFPNGATSASVVLDLRGILQPYDVYVVNNASAAAPGIIANSDTTSQVCNFNGDDAVALFRGNNPIDIIGEIGVDPGSSWPVGTGSTVNLTLIRADTVQGPETNWVIGATQWVINSVNTDTLIGYHLSTCSNNCPPLFGNFTTVDSALQVQFNDISTVFPTGWSWDFGDGNTSTQQNPIHTYTQPGSYQVCLTVSNSCATPNTYCDSIQVILPPPPCQELFFSEYMEGSSSNKYVEIYNPSSNPINLSGYSIELYTNGSLSPNNIENLTGTLAAQDVYVITNSSASLPAVTSASNLTSAICNFNGDDALALRKNGQLLDVIGEIGVDPGSSWPVGTGSTVNNTLRRADTVRNGTPFWSAGQNQWEVFAQDTDSFVDFHNSVCATGCNISANFSFAANLQTLQFTDQSGGSPIAWFWDFGDGSSSTQQNPSHTYAQTGTFTVCLVATAACGSDHLCQNVTVSCPVPTVSFTTTPNGLTVAFTDQSQPGVNGWFWDFGDGNISSLQNPTHTYTQPGTYNVCLTVISPCGSGFGCQLITVTCPAPVAAFQSSPNQLSVQFTNQSTGSGVSYFWDFGDGNSSTLQNPSHTYAQSGTYTVCLIAQSICGADTTCSNVTVICPTPGTAFSSSANQLAYQFTDLSSNSPTSWLWDFGDGNTSTQQNPAHTYAQPGTYTVCLTTTNSCGSDSSCSVIQVICPTPGTAFSSSANQLAYQFTDLSSNSPTSWLWDFGDGNSSTQQNPAHTYAQPGTYTVCLTTTNSCGSDSSCSVIQVSCGTPQTAFNNSVSQLTATFTDLSSGGATAWFWDFGDGNTSNQQNPSHSYAVGGTYTVCLTASSICGADTLCQTITVVCPAPQAAFNSSNAGLTVAFTDLSTQAPSGWIWDFGDGNISTQQNPSHSYAQPGTYTVCLSVSDTCGNDSVCATVQVSCPAPTAAFTSTPNQLSVQFSDQSSGGATQWFWDFGDGSTSNQQNPSHSYAQSGTYTVCLIANSLCGADTTCQNLTVLCPTPGTNFTANTNGLNAQFVDLSSNSPSSWFWDFGDGSSSTQQNPSHSYAQSGTYTVCLIAFNSCGADTSCSNVTVSCAAPQALFTQTSNNLSVSFNDLSSNSPSNWFWDFGDGSTSTQQNPSHGYAAPGSYVVCLIVSSPCGADTACTTLTLNCQSPSANFFFGANSNLLVNFTDASSNGPATWAWDFGDGFTSSLPSPSHTYANPGIYTVCLTVSNGCGNDSLCRVVNVNCPAPTPDFSWSGSFNQMQFTDLSLNGPSSWSWDFGDGNSSSQQNPQHSYAGVGIYTVCLTVSNACGSQSFCQQVSAPVSLAAQLANSFSIHPNPSKGRFALSLDLDHPEEISIEISDLRGKVLWHLPSAQRSDLQEQIDLGHLPKGLYLLRLQAGQESLTRRLVLQ